MEATKCLEIGLSNQSGYGTGSGLVSGQAADLRKYTEIKSSLKNELDAGTKQIASIGLNSDSYSVQTQISCSEHRSSKPQKETASEVHLADMQGDGCQGMTEVGRSRIDIWNGLRRERSGDSRGNGCGGQFVCYNNPFDQRLVFNGILPVGGSISDVENTVLSISQSSLSCRLPENHNMKLQYNTNSSRGYKLLEGEHLISGFKRVTSSVITALVETPDIPTPVVSNPPKNSIKDHLMPNCSTNVIPNKLCDTVHNWIRSLSAPASGYNATGLELCSPSTDLEKDINRSIMLDDDEDEVEQIQRLTRVIDSDRVRLLWRQPLLYSHLPEELRTNPPTQDRRSSVGPMRRPYSVSWCQRHKRAYSTSHRKRTHNSLIAQFLQALHAETVRLKMAASGKRDVIDKDSKPVTSRDDWTFTRNCCRTSSDVSVHLPLSTVIPSPGQKQISRGSRERGHMIQSNDSRPTISEMLAERQKDYYRTTEKTAIHLSGTMLKNGVQNKPGAIFKDKHLEKAVQCHEPVLQRQQQYLQQQPQLLQLLQQPEQRRQQQQQVLQLRFPVTNSAAPLRHLPTEAHSPSDAVNLQAKPASSSAQTTSAADSLMSFYPKTSSASSERSSGLSLTTSSFPDIRQNTHETSQNSLLSFLPQPPWLPLTEYLDVSQHVNAGEMLRTVTTHSTSLFQHPPPFLVPPSVLADPTPVLSSHSHIPTNFTEKCRSFQQLPVISRSTQLFVSSRQRQSHEYSPLEDGVVAVQSTQPLVYGVKNCSNINQSATNGLAVVGSFCPTRVVSNSTEFAAATLGNTSIAIESEKCTTLAATAPAWFPPSFGSSTVWVPSQPESKTSWFPHTSGMMPLWFNRAAEELGQYSMRKTQSQSQGAQSVVPETVTHRLSFIPASLVTPPFTRSQDYRRCTSSAVSSDGVSDTITSHSGGFFFTKPTNSLANGIISMPKQLLSSSQLTAGVKCSAPEKILSSVAVVNSLNDACWYKNVILNGANRISNKSNTSNNFTGSAGNADVICCSRNEGSNSFCASYNTPPPPCSHSIVDQSTLSREQFKLAVWRVATAGKRNFVYSPSPPAQPSYVMLPGNSMFNHPPPDLFNYPPPPVDIVSRSAKVNGRVSASVTSWDKGQTSVSNDNIFMFPPPSSFLPSPPKVSLYGRSGDDTGNWVGCGKSVDGFQEGGRERRVEGVAGGLEGAGGTGRRGRRIGLGIRDSAGGSYLMKSSKDGVGDAGQHVICDRSKYIFSTTGFGHTFSQSGRRGPSGTGAGEHEGGGGRVRVNSVVDGSPQFRSTSSPWRRRRSTRTKQGCAAKN